MAKATIQDITDAGFRAEQFGTPADWTTSGTGYLARLLTQAQTWVKGMVGADPYAAAASGSIAELRLRQAELCYAKAELWRRRAAFLDSNAFSAIEGNPSAARERESYLKQADSSDACAQFHIDLFNNDGDVAASGSGVALGSAETGPYATASGVLPCAVLP
jgi:hypothetical protein